MLKAEAEIRGRYSSEEFESLKRNVFGISLEKRAEVAGLSQLYDASYRVLSRNVHAMDVAVMEITRSASAPEEHKELLEARTSHLLEMAQWCLGTLAIWVNGQFRCGFDDRQRSCRRAREECAAQHADAADEARAGRSLTWPRSRLTEK